MDTTLCLLGGGGGGLSRTSSDEVTSNLSKSELDCAPMSSQGSSHPNEADLELGLGLSLGGGGGSNYGGRILTAKDFPIGFSARANSTIVGPVSGTKRAIADDSVGSASTGVSQVVGWPPVKAHRMNSLVSQTKTLVAGEEDRVGFGGNKICKNTLEKNLDNRTIKNDATAKGHVGFVKVNMDGLQIGRKVDLNAHGCYETLAQSLEDMFLRSTATVTCKRSGGVKEQATQPSKLLDGSSEFVLTYEDKDGDWMLVGDVPWRMFRGTVKRLRIMRTSEANGLAAAAAAAAPRFQEQNGKQRHKPI